MKAEDRRQKLTDVTVDLRGAKLSIAWIDEAGEVDPAAWQEVTRLASLRDAMLEDALMAAVPPWPSGTLTAASLRAQPSRRPYGIFDPKMSVT